MSARPRKPRLDISITFDFDPAVEVTVGDVGRSSNARGWQAHEPALVESITVTGGGRLRDARIRKIGRDGLPSSRTMTLGYVGEDGAARLLVLLGVKDQHERLQAKCAELRADIEAAFS